MQYIIHRKKVIQVVQIGGGRVIWTKSKRTAVFFSLGEHPLGMAIQPGVFPGGVGTEL